MVAQLVAMSRTNTQTCEARPHCTAASLPPGDGLPSRRRQGLGQGTNRKRTPTLGTSYQLWRSPLTTIGKGAQRLAARSPDRRLTRDPYHVGNSLFRQSVA